MAFIDGLAVWAAAIYNDTSDTASPWNVTISLSLSSACSLQSLTSWCQQHTAHQIGDQGAALKKKKKHNQRSQHTNKKKAEKAGVSSFSKNNSLRCSKIQLWMSYFYSHLLRSHQPGRRSEAEPLANDLLLWKPKWAKSVPKKINVATSKAKQQCSFKMTPHSIPALLCQHPTRNRSMDVSSETITEHSTLRQIKVSLYATCCHGK